MPRAGKGRQVMDADGAPTIRKLLTVPRARARREFRSIVRRDLANADVQVTRSGEPWVVLVSPARQAQLDWELRQLAELKKSG
jgi:hypothetical protein